MASILESIDEEAVNSQGGLSQGMSSNVRINPKSKTHSKKEEHYSNFIKAKSCSDQDKKPSSGVSMNGSEDESEGEIFIYH
jgi:hypothetical protein